MPKNKGLQPGSPLPSFTLKGADGLTYRSIDFKGKPVLFLFHRGTWCPSCRLQLTQLAKNIDSFKRLGVEVISILGQKEEAVKTYLEKHPLPFPVLIDETRDVIKAFDVYHAIGFDAYNIARPSVFLVSPDQKILYGYVGRYQADLPKQEKLAETVHELLESILTE